MNASNFFILVSFAKKMSKILEIFAKKPVKKKFKLSQEFAKDLNIVSDNGTKQMILTSKEQQEKIENLNEEND